MFVSWLLAFSSLHVAQPFALEIFGADLGIDHDVLILEKKNNIGATKEEVAKLFALLQFGTKLGCQIDGRYVCHPDRKDRDQPQLRGVNHDKAAFLVELIRITIHNIKRTVRLSEHVHVHLAMDVTHLFS